MRGGASGAAKGLSETRAALRVTMTASGLFGVRNETSMSCLESGVPVGLVSVGAGGWAVGAKYLWRRRGRFLW